MKETPWVRFVLPCVAERGVCSAIASDCVCSELLFEAWYMDDGI